MNGRPQAVRRGSVGYESVVVVTRPTRLEELVRRFNTVAQARFYLEHAGEPFAPIEEAHRRHHAALDRVRRAVPTGLRSQVVDRDDLPQMLFTGGEAVVTVGQDGLVANTAKYVHPQPILAVNPDPDRFDGILLPFTAATAPAALRRLLAGEAPLREVSMAEAVLTDGQRLLGFNDLFIGPDAHASARYRIAHAGREEEQSSSGVIVSTGVGSSGWLQSVYAGAAGVVEALGGRVVPPRDGGRFPWDQARLVFAVREPFPSRTSSTGLVYGIITPEAPLELESRMSAHGVIFSDGQLADFVGFSAGVAATVRPAAEKARLVAA